MERGPKGLPPGKKVTVGSRILSLTLDELWAIHKYVRRTREQEGQEFDKDFMLEVFRGIATLECKPRDEQAQATWELPCEESDLWQISRLVDMEYCRGGKYTGYSLLTKTMRCLTEEGTWSSEEAQAVYRQAIKEWEDASTNRNAS